MGPAKAGEWDGEGGSAARVPASAAGAPRAALGGGTSAGADASKRAQEKTRQKGEKDAGRGGLQQSMDRGLQQSMCACVQVAQALLKGALHKRTHGQTLERLAIGEGEGAIHGGDALAKGPLAKGRH